MMKLLVDAGEFMESLGPDLRNATTSALAQTMTFEGDHAGRRFANLLIRSPCPDRRLVVDCFSRHVLSGCFVHSLALSRDAELRAEAMSTEATHEALRRSGVRVRFCNPPGTFMHRFPARDHKKMVVIDGRIAYLGGLNISDHNFAWHDLMIRIEDAAVAAFLADDLEATWRSRPSPRWQTFDGIRIGSLNGRDNARGFEPVFDLIASAREDIMVETPYLTFPFTDRLRAARRRGVRVRVLTSSPHPRPSVLRSMEWECARSGFELRLLPGMTHVKAMLIDGRKLVLGSSNFDYLSYRLLHEILAIVDEPRIVADFVERVAVVDLARSRVSRPARHRWTGYLRRFFMETAGETVARVSGAGSLPPVPRSGSPPRFSAVS
jgi:cardiolipin synthase A/B